jgi:long-chain fatty acid transport protein
MFVRRVSFPSTTGSRRKIFRAGACLALLLAMSLSMPFTSRAQEAPDLGITLPPSINFASPPTPVGSGARAEGMGGAFIGIADDATAASWNPAGLIQLERPEVSCVGAFVWNSESPTSLRPSVQLASSEYQDQNLNYLSMAYPFRVFRRNIVVSLNLQRLYDFHAETEALAQFEDLFGTQKVSSVQSGTLYTITPSVAIQILPSLSVGISVNFWKDGAPGEEWQQEVQVQGKGIGVVGNKEVPFSYNGTITEEYGFWGINLTAGVLWSIGKIFSVGGVVKTPFRADLDFKHVSQLEIVLEDPTSEPIPPSRREVSKEIHMDMPLSYGVGVSARFSDAWSVDLDFSRTEWSGFERESFLEDLPDFIWVDTEAPSGKGRDVLAGMAGATNHIRLGGEYVVLHRAIAVPLRLGLFYDPEPNVDNPDDFWGVSSGIGITCKRVSFDLAYTFRTGSRREPAADVRVYQHRLLSSVIVYF